VPRPIRKASQRQSPCFSAISASPTEIRASLERQLKEAARSFVYGLMLQEAQELCGSLYSRGRSRADGVFRAGSDPGSVKLAGQRLRVKKPRLKQSGKERELKSYQALQDFDLLQPKVMAHLLRGVSTRQYEPLLEQVSGGLGLKKSSVSKAFVRGSRQALEELTSRKLEQFKLCAVMIDGIAFSGRRVIVALGITAIGERLVLGLREGETENTEVVKDLLHGMIERGLDTSQPFLFVIDGSKSLRRAIRSIFGERQAVQRCSVHKARNILSYLPEKYHQEFNRRWFSLHRLEKYDDAKVQYQELRHWLSRITRDALSSLDEAEEETLTIVRLGAGRILRRALHSTNYIEGLFDKVRHTTRRVKNWRKGPDQVLRWTASALLEAESRKRKARIQGHYEIDIFLKRLANDQKPLPERGQVA
jgi:putative transposase